MDNPIENDAEMAELKYEKVSGSIEDDETNETASVALKDPDTMLSMIVLLLACLALAALAHLFV